MSSIYDNWGRLVAAAIKKEQFRRMALAPPSTESSFNSRLSDSDLDSETTSLASLNRHNEFGENVPGISQFQIIGSAEPGSKILACGYPVNGTSLVMFQWIRYHLDGGVHYIEGATNPEYVVTADDVGRRIVVECIPMDDQGRQGDLVKAFANYNNPVEYVDASFGRWIVQLYRWGKTTKLSIFHSQGNRYSLKVDDIDSITDTNHTRDTIVRTLRQFIIKAGDKNDSSSTYK